MARPTPEYIAGATSLVEAKIQALQNLSYEEASSLPEVEDADVVLAGNKASITTFRYADAYQLEGKTLIVVLAAKPSFFGMCSFHIERGLIFSPIESPRSATELELQNSGG